MNVKLLANVASLFVSIAPKVKGWIFSDGKFLPTRAGTLLLALVILMIGSAFMEPEAIKTVTDALDDISDMIGYVDK